MPETIASVSTATNRMTAANRGYTEERSEKVTYGVDESEQDTHGEWEETRSILPVDEVSLGTSSY